MARLFYTGFETGAAEWNGAATTVLTTPTVQNTIKRTGSYAVKIGSYSATPGYFRQVFDADETEIFGRFAFYIESVASQRTHTLWSFRDDNNGVQCAIQYDEGTQCLNWTDGAGTVLDVGFVLIPTETWVVVEFRVLIDGAAGSLTLKVNGTTDAVYSGDTDYTNRTTLRSVYIGTFTTSNSSVVGYVYYDDIAINDTAGSYQNSYAGLGGVFYLYPTADGAQNDWTPSAGSVNYAMVDERPPDNATTFNQALDTASIDLYEVDDCPEYIASINCLQVAYRAALVTSGYNELTDLVRVGTVNYSGLEYTVVPITPSFTYYLGTIHYLNPGSGSAWGTVEVNAMQAGIEITT